jgi:hypothetical protein
MNAVATEEAVEAELTAQAPTPEPTEDNGVYFFDDFSSGSGWERYLTSTIDIGIFDSAYRMAIRESETGYWISAGPTLEDIRVEADVEQLGSDDASQVGLICRFISDRNFYVASISAAGVYSIYKLVTNEWTELRYGEIDLPQDALATAHLTLDCVGDTIAFFVNDELIAVAYDSSFSKGQAGVYADSYWAKESVFLFDNFLVSRPPSDSPAANGESAEIPAEVIAADLALAGYEPDQGELAWSSRNEYEISVEGEHYFMTWQDLDSRHSHANFVLAYDAAWETTTGLAGCGAIMRGGTDLTRDAQIRLETWRFSGAPSWVFEYIKFNQRQGYISGEIRSSGAIDQSNGSTNHFVIVADGVTFTAYVNGERLGVGTGPQAVAEGQLAVYTWQESGTSTCTFSNIWIWDILK